MILEHSKGVHMREETRARMAELMWKQLQPRLFKKEPEKAHLFTIRSLKLMEQANLLWVLRLLFRSSHYKQPTYVFGTEWRNPVGLAAGFDKHGQVLRALDALGFGSVEFGTVTPYPQFGNDPPRVFRYPQMQAIVNRYGFNSVGMEQFKKNFLRSIKPHIPLRMAIGVSIGKNKTTPDNAAVSDYITALEFLGPDLRFVDWIKINISSPNTPNLRDTFNRLDEFLDELTGKARRLLRGVPLVLKVPPDNLSPDDLDRVAILCMKYEFAGIEATNTTTNEKIKGRFGIKEEGGVSGDPLREQANIILGHLAETLPRRSSLVGVGGITSAHHAEEKHALGAKAVQLYSGLVFRGPRLLNEILARSPKYMYSRR